MVEIMVVWFSGIASALIPGLGHLFGGRGFGGPLFFGLAAALHVTTGGLAYTIAPDLAADALVYGGFAFPSDRVSPTVVVTTVLIVGTHLGAAWDAAHQSGTSAASRGASGT